MTQHQKSKIFGNYFLENVLLGEGNFGRVDLAKHFALGTRVALKHLVPQNQNLDALACLRREGKILSDLRHDNIIQLIEISSSDLNFFLVLEYVGHNAKNLNQILFTDGPFSENAARLLLRQLTSAISYLHTNMILHRDIKLDNILFNPDQQRLVLIDFGLSGVWFPGKEMKKHCGSPEYCAPELLRQEKYYGPAIDVWSFGIVFYAILIGNIPFVMNASDDRKCQKLVQQIKDGLTENHLKKMQQCLSHDCIQLIEKCLDTNAKTRITSHDLRVEKWMMGNVWCPVPASVKDRPRQLLFDAAVEVQKVLKFEQTTEGVLSHVAKYPFGRTGGMFNIMLMQKQETTQEILRSHSSGRVSNVSQKFSFDEQVVTKNPDAMPQNRHLEYRTGHQEIPGSTNPDVSIQCQANYTNTNIFNGENTFNLHERNPMINQQMAEDVPGAKRTNHPSAEEIQASKRTNHLMSNEVLDRSNHLMSNEVLDRSNLMMRGFRTTNQMTYNENYDSRQKNHLMNTQVSNSWRTNDLMMSNEIPNSFRTNNHTMPNNVSSNSWMANNFLSSEVSDSSRKNLYAQPTIAATHGNDLHMLPMVQTDHRMMKDFSVPEMKQETFWAKQQMTPAVSHRIHLQMDQHNLATMNPTNHWTFQNSIENQKIPTLHRTYHHSKAIEGFNNPQMISHRMDFQNLSSNKYNHQDTKEIPDSHMMKNHLVLERSFVSSRTNPSRVHDTSDLHNIAHQQMAQMDKHFDLREMSVSHWIKDKVESRKTNQPKEQKLKDFHRTDQQTDQMIAQDSQSIAKQRLQSKTNQDKLQEVPDSYRTHRHDTSKRSDQPILQDSNRINQQMPQMNADRMMTQDSQRIDDQRFRRRAKLQDIPDSHRTSQPITSKRNDQQIVQVMPDSHMINQQMPQKMPQDSQRVDDLKMRRSANQTKMPTDSHRINQQIPQDSQRIDDLKMRRSANQTKMETVSDSHRINQQMPPKMPQDYQRIDDLKMQRSANQTKMEKMPTDSHRINQQMPPKMPQDYQRVDDLKMRRSANQTKMPTDSHRINQQMPPKMPQDYQRVDDLKIRRSANQTKMPTDSHRINQQLPPKMPQDYQRVDDLKIRRSANQTKIQTDSHRINQQIPPKMPQDYQRVDDLKMRRSANQTKMPTDSHRINQPMTSKRTDDVKVSADDLPLPQRINHEKVRRRTYKPRMPASQRINHDNPPTRMMLQDRQRHTESCDPRLARNQMPQAIGKSNLADFYNQ